jgi:hypothetical protein
MQELGVWTTAEGATPARLQLESEEELPGWASGAIQGALTGAATGAVAGPYGALIGAAAGGALGAASGASAPAGGAARPSAAPASKGAGPAGGTATTTMSRPSGDAANRARAVQALQQFATAVPILVQLVAASGRESGPGEDGGTRESLEGFEEAEWGPESFQGTWSVP